MENEYKKNIIFIIAIAFCIILSGNVYNSIQSYKYRRLCDQYREQLNKTTEANRKLADTIGECQSITGSIGELCNRNISSSQGIIEFTEELRAQVYDLENCIRSFSQFEYYNYWDNEFGISQ